MILRLKKFQIMILLVALSLCLLNSTVMATATGETEQPTELPSMGGYLLRIIISMIFIVIITYLVMKILKRQNSIQQRQKSWLRIYDYQGLGTNRGIYLMEILGKIYVIGISDGQFSLLREIDPEDEYWNDIKDSLENSQEDIIPAGLKKWLLGNTARFVSTRPTAGQSFEKELDKQLDRSQRLFNHVSKGGKDDE